MKPLSPELFLFSLALFAAVPSFAEGSSEVYVQIQSAKLRQTPKQWAAGIANLKFGDKLTLIDKQDSWLQVRTDVRPDSSAESSLQGYLHSSAVTAQKIQLSANRDDLLNGEVAETDVYLAGKGFNEGVMSSYLQSEPAVDMKAVEKMLQDSKIEGDELKAFIVSGRLSEG